MKELRNLINDHNSNAIIEVDGGVNSKNAKKLIECGANALVAGSFVFKSEILQILFQNYLQLLISYK